MGSKANPGLTAKALVNIRPASPGPDRSPRPALQRPHGPEHTNVVYNEEDKEEDKEEDEDEDEGDADDEAEETESGPNEETMRKVLFLQRKYFVTAAGTNSRGPSMTDRSAYVPHVPDAQVSVEAAAELDRRRGIDATRAEADANVSAEAPTTGHPDSADLQGMARQPSSELQDQASTSIPSVDVVSPSKRKAQPDNTAPGKRRGRKIQR